MKLFERIANFTDSVLFVALGLFSMNVVIKEHYPLWFGAVIAFTGLVTIYLFRWVFRGRESDEQV